MDPLPLHAYVVEDNTSMCENLVDTLEALTCVRVVGTGSAQLQAAQWLTQHARDWDLLIVDLFLKGGSGMHLLELLGTHAPWQKVIVLSNYANASIRKRCAQLGVDAVFDKSTEIDALVDYCTRQCFLLGQAAARQGRPASAGPSATPLTPGG